MWLNESSYVNIRRLTDNEASTMCELRARWITSHRWFTHGCECCRGSRITGQKLLAQNWKRKKMKKGEKKHERNARGGSKREIRKTVQLNTLSWYLTCGGSQWDVAYLPDSWNSVTCVGMASEHTSMVCIAQKPRVDSRCESLYRSGLFYYSNPDELEKGTISIRRENRLKRSSKQAHLAHSEQTEIVTAKKMWVRDKRWTLRCNVC